MADGDNGAAVDALKDLLKVNRRSMERLGQQLMQAREQVKVLTAERDAAITARDEANAAATKAAKDFDSEPLKAEAEQLRGQLRERDHRALFDRLAKERGVADDALEPLYRLSGYKVEGDAPDEAKMGAMLDELKAKPGVGRLYGEPAPAAPPPGSGQGARLAHGGKFRVTTDQLRDGAWCMANADRMRQAKKDGTFELVQS